MAQILAQGPDFLQRLQHVKDICIIGQKRLLPAFQHFVHDIVGQAAVHVDDSGHNLVARDLPPRGKLHLAGQGQAIHPRIQRADAVGQFLWQHGYYPVHQVHGSTALTGLQIQRLILPHIEAHICDINPQKIAAVGLLFRIHTIVQILGILAVHRHDPEIPTVAAAAVFIWRRLLLGLVGGLLHQSRELFGKVILAHDGQDIHPRSTGLAQDFHHFPFGIPAAIRPFRDPDHHLGTCLGAVNLLFRDEDILSELHIVRLHEAEGLAAFKGAHDFLVGPFQYAQNLPLTGASFLSRRTDTGQYPIPVHGGAHPGPRHENVRLRLVLPHIGDNKAKALGRHGDVAHHQVHAGRRTVKAAAVAHDGAFLLHFLQHLGKCLHFLARKLQGRCHCLCLGGPVVLSAHKRQNTFFQIHIVVPTLRFQFSQLFSSRKAAARAKTSSRSGSRGSRCPALPSQNISFTQLPTCS